MIRNLNQMTFREYGAVMPERNRSDKAAEMTQELSLSVDNAHTALYIATADTRLRMHSGMSVLSVSLDGEKFENFYLDKSVNLREGVYFAVIPFMRDAVVNMIATKQLEQAGERPCDSLRMDRRLRVGGIYTFYYQEREQGFLFPGEAHPMPELTYVDQGELHSVADGQDILLKQGDIAVFGPDQWHMHYADIGVAPGYITITFDLEGVDVTPLLNRKFAAPQPLVALQICG